MLKLVGLTFIVGDPQLHDTITGTVPWPENVSVALAGQAVLGTMIVMGMDWPAVKTPLAWLKLMPLMPLLEADQLNCPWSFGPVPRVKLHVQPLAKVQSVFPLKLLLLAVNVKAPQLHGITTWFPGPVKVKVTLAGHTLFGIEIVTDAVWPGSSVPFCWLKVTPEPPLLLALQLRLLCAVAKLLSVAVQVQPAVAL
jgi:hypothetical protein